MLAAPRRLVFRYRQGGDAVDQMLDAIRAGGLRVTGVATRQPDLEKVFLRLVGREVPPRQ
jgi:hypothetical protein